jgi:hypothetical protein
VRLWRNAMLTVIAASSVLALVVFVGQVHHDNGCTQYGNALRSAVSDPEDGPASTASQLPADLQATARASDKTYRQTFGQTNGATVQGWDQFVANFVAGGMADKGC